MDTEKSVVWTFWEDGYAVLLYPRTRLRCLRAGWPEALSQPPWRGLVSGQRYVTMKSSTRLCRCRCRRRRLCGGWSPAIQIISSLKKQTQTHMVSYLIRPTHRALWHRNTTCHSECLCSLLAHLLWLYTLNRLCYCPSLCWMYSWLTYQYWKGVRDTNLDKGSFQIFFRSRA